MRPVFDPWESPQDPVRHQILSQRKILVEEAPARLVATLLAYAVSAAFLPVLFVATLAAINLLAEIMVDLVMRDVDMLMARKTRRWVLCGCTFVHEACFVLPPAVIWHLDDPLAKAFAVGMSASTMMHIATVRAIYLPMGLSGALAISIIVLTSNGLYWIGKFEWISLSISMLCAVVALGYFLSALLSNNRLHRATSASWAAAVVANAAKGRFLAQMSHELRTPLNAILGVGHAELSCQNDPVSRSRLELLVDSAAGLGVLLDDILDLSAVQEGRLPIRPETINPRFILTASAALFRPQAEAAGLRLDLRLDPNLPAAGRADGRRLRQCLSNILSNAIKYTAQGEILMTARMAGQDLLCIEVDDSGEGVPEDLRETIFEPFGRGRGLQAGTGLGLTISRTLARRMGGDLVLLPSQQGARFCLTLPLEPVSSLPVPSMNLPALHLPSLYLHGRLILVVDDIASNRLVAATYLRFLGAEVAEANSGEAALQLIATIRPAAVLLDMNMPGLSGIETFKRLRQTQGGAKIPVIAVTADATDEHRRMYLAAGLDGFVTKPLSPERLAETMRHHLPPSTDLAAGPEPAQILPNTETGRHTTPSGAKA